jgi:hypothetical protein
MYGGYITQRGWIKLYDHNKNDFICCRSPADIQIEFIFKNKQSITKFEAQYKNELQYVTIEYKPLSKEKLFEKRVIPSKKGKSYYAPNLVLEQYSDKYYNSYCRWCKLLITADEYSLDDNICIHCAHELYKKIHGYYAKMPLELKESWERARIINEI